MTAGRPPTRWRTVAKDPKHDDRLRYEGWTVTEAPIIDQVTRDELRDRFLQLHGPEGDGWHNGFNSLDFAYRTGSWDAIRAALEKPVTALFAEYRGFNFAFLCKWPGPESHLFIHQDWMYIEERPDRRTYAVMVALEDIDEPNGRPYVVSRSHLLPTIRRGTDLYAPWWKDADELEKRAEPVPVPAGHAAIWDSALVHFSVANLTDRPRIAAGLGVAPVGEPLVHYRRSGPGRADRFTISERFFSESHPSTLLAGPPPFPHDGTFDTDERDLEPGELLAELDQLRSA